MIEDLWYKNTVIYSLDLETYLDSTGDGTGDFEGLVRRLDYLDALGIDTLWLAPFQPTPNRDNGYDVSDFYGVDPRHGSSGDFVELMWQARQRGIRVIIDLVANHTSDQHRWFQEARRDERYDWRGSSLVTLHNFDEKPHEARLEPHPGGDGRLTSLLVDERLAGDPGGTYRVPLEAYGYRWYRIGGMTDLLQREKG